MEKEAREGFFFHSVQWELSIFDRLTIDICATAWYNKVY